MRKNIFFIAFLTLTMLWSSACTSKNSGHSSISNSNSNTTSSESASSETPSLDCAHNYQLNDGQTLYVCSLCGDSMPSGSGSLSNDGNDFIGDDYVSDYEEKYDMQSKNYLFIGSSAANGFHSAADPTRTSMATMMRDDYLTADYTIYENGALVEYKSVYLRKISSPSNDGKIEGTYSWGTHTVKLNQNGSASLNGVAFAYFTNENAITLRNPIESIFSFDAVLRSGDTVYKYTSDGNSISAYATYLDPQHPTRYDNNGNAIAMDYSSIGYEGSKTKYERSYVCQLLDAIHDIGDQPIDKVFIQLSTNDIGQFTSAAATEHLPFGSIDDSAFDVNSFDLSTSFGSMEYIIAKIKEQWKDAEIVIFSCWMMDSDWTTYVNSKKDWDTFVAEYSDQNNYNNVSEYAKMRLGLMQIIDKWDVGFIDCWADYQLNSLLNGENKSLYKADTVHLTEAGYEKAVFGIFRSSVDGTYKNWEA